jgi:asparagine synthase (glutamine-hydrolysing)
MCGIAGIVSENERDLGSSLKTMLQAMRHRGPDGAGFTVDRYTERAARLEDLALAGKRGKVAVGHVRLAITGESTALQPFGSANGRIVLLHNGEIYNHDSLRDELKEEFDFQTGSDSEVVLRLVEKQYRGDLQDAVRRVLPKLDGVYALTLTDNKTTVIARDRIGVRQLYYRQTEEGTAFASEKKPLTALADSRSEIQRLLPGHMATLDGQNIRNFRYWSQDSIRPDGRVSNKTDALDAYGAAIVDAIRKRIAGRKRVGIIFSGGIDSLLIAHLTATLGIPFTCYTAGRGAQAADLAWALRLANRFDFPTQVRRLNADDIQELVPQIITDIEDHSLNQVEVAVPIYASMRMAQEAGERVVLTGQGADELFGGYSWYPTVVDTEGYGSFEQRSWEDTFLLYKECLEREDKIAMAHSIELRVPFLDPEVIKVAFQIAPELKIDRGGDSVGKLIHRQYCTSIGIPRDVAYRVKEAAQHGANVHTAFEELAQRRGYTEKRLTAAGYDPERSVTEKLGSSSRYGYRYGDQHLWKPLPHVQYYLDAEAARLDMLPQRARKHFQEVERRLRV